MPTTFSCEGASRRWLNTKSNNVEARSLLGRAIAISPDFAAAYALFAFTHVMIMPMAGAKSPSDLSRPVWKSRGGQLQMDDEDPYAHVDFAVALLGHREHDRALAEVRRSLALAPNFGRRTFDVAHISDTSAVTPRQRSTRSMPICGLILSIPRFALYFLAQAQVSLGQFDAAVATLKRRLERNPNSADLLALLASCYGHLGKIAEARAAWAEVMRIAPNFSIDRQRRILPYKNSSDFERCRVEGIAKSQYFLERALTRCMCDVASWP